MSDTKQKVQQDFFEWIAELNKFKDRGFALADRVGALEMNISCPTVIESNKTITDLGITQITSAQAYITFNIDPPVDVQVEINDGTGFVSLANTGVFASHNYAIHNQINLTPLTTYTVRLTALGQDPCTTTFTTEDSSASLAFNTHELTDGDNLTNMSSKGNGETLVTFQPNSSYGIDPKLDLDPNETEAWFAYDILLPLNWAPTSNTKLPGFASAETSNTIGGQGGGGGGGNDATSARMIIHRPSTAADPHTFVSNGVGFEIYHDASPTQPFGDTEWWGNVGAGSSSPTTEAAITLGTWATLKQYKKLNTPGQNDGILRGYIDGVLQYERTNLGFTDDDTTSDGDPDAQEMAIWMNFFIGGLPDTSGNANQLCIRNERYNYGSVDLT